VSLLLYCVFESSTGPIPEGVAGVDGLPVLALFAGGLGAAVSRVDSNDLKPNVARALAYGEAIEIFYRNFSLIPMRYGSFLRDEDAVLGLLARNEEAFKSLLQKLDGCVEMGVRILLPETLDESLLSRKRCEQTDSAVDALGINSGRAYLESKKRSFSERDRLGMLGKEAIENCKAALQGLFVDTKVEEHAASTLPGHLASEGDASFSAPTAVVYFLVRKERLEAFCQSFEKMSATKASGMLLSGPWPPYNFATLSLIP
jgi:hypothetical protein